MRGPWALLLILIFATAGMSQAQVTGRWLSGDFHTHTWLSDGRHSFEEICDKAFNEFGIDWLVNTDHGGCSIRDPYGNYWDEEKTRFVGNPPRKDGRQAMWRWQAIVEYSFPIVHALRAKYPDKLIMQGCEWNMPGHGHLSVAIMGKAEEDGFAVARHAYLFDRRDEGRDGNRYLGLSEKAVRNPFRGLAGLAWLQSEYRGSAFAIVNHPSREMEYGAADYREFHDAAPDVFLGFEGMPGYQSRDRRGNYRSGFRRHTSKARTYGGADLMLAQVGGVWDSLLGEGRRLWMFSSSDFHGAADNRDFWPGQYSRTHAYVEDLDGDARFDELELLAALRSGNCFGAHGELINALEFRADTIDSYARMGGTLDYVPGQPLVLTVRFRTPDTNANGDAPQVHHVDVIAGEVGPKAPRGSVAFRQQTNTRTRIIGRVESRHWVEEDGWTVARMKIDGVSDDMYFRLRGTNLPPGVEGETDRDGNPLPDCLAGMNCDRIAFADLWFYSNPIFLKVFRN